MGRRSIRAGDVTDNMIEMPQGWAGVAATDTLRDPGLIILSICGRINILQLKS